MTTKQAQTLTVGQTITHTRYGACAVKEVQWCRGDIFGVLIQPSTDAGIARLAEDCGVTDIHAFLEDSLRRLKLEVTQ